MTAGIFALVVLSAIAHAYWNFLLKRAGGAQVFLGLSKVVEAILIAPALAIVLAGRPSEAGNLFAFACVGTGLALLNYILLAKAYSLGDLSLAYPVSRGAILVFLPPLAFVVFRELPSATGWIALATILAGILAIQVPAMRGTSQERLGETAGFAVAAALMAAGYTVWDKRAVSFLSPIAYYSAYTFLLGLTYVPYLVRQPKGQVSAEWRGRWKPIVQVGLLNTGSYLLALVALQHGKASYVIAVRQLSIALGALFGAKLLGEALPAARRVGIALMVVGCVLLAFAR